LDGALMRDLIMAIICTILDYSKQSSTDRSTEQLASAATYFGAIVTKMTQHQAQQQVVQRHRSQGMEL
jgi:hypothetical protein